MGFFLRQYEQEQPSAERMVLVDFSFSSTPHAMTQDVRTGSHGLGIPRCAKPKAFPLHLRVVVNDNDPSIAAGWYVCCRLPERTVKSKKKDEPKLRPV